MSVSTLTCRCIRYSCHA